MSPRRLGHLVTVSIPVDKVRAIGNNARLVVRFQVSIPVDKVRAKVRYFLTQLREERFNPRG